MTLDTRISTQTLAPVPAVTCMHEASQRVLSRTAHSLAAGAGGLRFVAGSHPWLHGVPDGRRPSRGLEEVRT